MRKVDGTNDSATLSVTRGTVTAWRSLSQPQLVPGGLALTGVNSGCDAG